MKGRKDMVLPDFLIIGTLRGGTTSLYRYLVAHPQVAKAKDKEIHYFDNLYSKGLSWYVSCFKKRKEEIIGEATPNYLWRKEVPSRVSHLLPKVKLIVLLRNPIERAYSHWSFDRKWFKKTFEKAIQKESRFLTIGLYAEQLERWFKFYPRNRFLILKSEDFFKNEVGIYSQVLIFLKLEVKIPNIVKKGKVFKKGSKAFFPMKEETRKSLKQYYQKPNQKLYKLLKRDFGWD